MYVTQSFLHAFIASGVAAGAIRTWNVRSPVVKQRFRFALILFPIFSFPAYQIFNPERSTAFFRLEALFDSSRWLNMELWGTIPLHPFFLAVLLITSVIFFLQELVPIVRHTIESKQAIIDGEPPDDDSAVSKALEALPGEKPNVVVIDDDELVLFSSTGKNASIIISTGLVRSLTGEQMLAALAHENAHILRSRRPVLLLVFFLRMLMFFNPVVLVEFRRAVRNEEKICDDIAVSITQRPDVLAEALKKFYSPREDPETGEGKEPPASMAALDEYSHNLQLESRVTRLEQGLTRNTDGGWALLIFVFAVIAGINYFVV